MATKAPTSFRRYTVSDRLRCSLDEACERLAARRFVPLSADSAEDERWGWITTDHLLDTRFDIGKCCVGAFLVFALRMDKRRVPAALVRAHLRIEELAALQATGRRLKPAERRDLREEIEARLRPQVLPAARSVTAIWQPKRRLLYFGATADRPNELFRDLFEQTFDLELEVVRPGSLARAFLERRVGEAADPDRLGLLVPTRFTVPGGSPLAAQMPAFEPALVA